MTECTTMTECIQKTIEELDARIVDLTQIRDALIRVFEPPVRNNSSPKAASPKPEPDPVAVDPNPGEAPQSGAGKTVKEMMRWAIMLCPTDREFAHDCLRDLTMRKFPAQRQKIKEGFNSALHFFMKDGEMECRKQGRKLILKRTDKFSRPNESPGETTRRIFEEVHSGEAAPES